MLKKNSKITIYIILILLIFLSSAGITFAALYLVKAEEEDSTRLYAGTLIIEYSQGEIIKDEKFYPVDRPTLDNHPHTYLNTFTIKNTGTWNSLLSVNIELNKNEFSNNALSYALYNSEQQQILEGKIPKTGSIELMSNIKFPPQAEAEYTLMIWLEENNTNQSSEQRKELTATIVANASQLIEE